MSKCKLNPQPRSSVTSAWEFSQELEKSLIILGAWEGNPFLLKIFENLHKVVVTLFEQISTHKKIQ